MHSFAYISRLLRLFFTSTGLTLVTICVCKGQFVGRYQVKAPGHYSGKGIDVERFEFESYVDDLIIDSSGKNFLLSLKRADPASGAGRRSSFMRFDCQKSAVLWKTKKYPATLSNITNQVVLKEVGGTSRKWLLDIETGAEVWKKSFEWIGFEPKDSIIYGNRVNLDPRKGPIEIFKAIEAYDEATGELVESFRAPLHNLEQSSFRLNDSTLVLENNGIHIINTARGSVWSYISPSQEWNLKTLSDDEISSRHVAYLNTFPKVHTGLSSNITIRKDSLFFAGNQTIACVNAAGALTWATELEREEMTASQLLSSGRYLILVNKGIRYTNGNPEVAGVPFVSIFNIHSGETLFKRTFSRGRIINSVGLNDKGIRILVEGKHVQIGLRPGFPVTEDELPDSKSSTIMAMVHGGFYLQEGPQAVRFCAPGSDSLYFKTNSDSLFILDSSFRILKKFHEKQAIQPIYKSLKLKIYGNTQLSLIANHDHKVLFTTVPCWNVAIRKEYLYLVHERFVDKIKIADLE